jgi:hypothetical protein
MAAAELIGASERQFRRLSNRYEAEGAGGLIDRRRGRISGRRVAVDWERRVNFLRRHGADRRGIVPRLEVGADDAGARRGVGSRE